MLNPTTRILRFGAELRQTVPLFIYQGPRKKLVDRVLGEVYELFPEKDPKDYDEYAPVFQQWIQQRPPGHSIADVTLDSLEHRKQHPGSHAHERIYVMKSKKDGSVLGAMVMVPSKYQRIINTLEKSPQYATGNPERRSVKNILRGLIATDYKTYPPGPSEAALTWTPNEVAKRALTRLFQSITGHAPQHHPEDDYEVATLEREDILTFLAKTEALFRQQLKRYFKVK